MSEIAKIFKQTVNYKQSDMTVECYVMCHITQYESRKSGFPALAYCFVGEDGKLIRQEDEATSDGSKKPPIYDLDEMKVSAMETMQNKGLSKWGNLNDYPKHLREYKKFLAEKKNPTKPNPGQSTNNQQKL